MGRIYTVPFSATAATTAVDFFEIGPADDKPVLIHSIYIGQSTEFGDAQAEMLIVEIRRGGTGMTSGSGGSAVTPIAARSSADAAAGFTAEAMNTTVATFTAGVLVLSDTFNVATGWQYNPPPEDMIGVSQANGGLVVRFGSTPADSITFTGTLVAEELG
jgi:hypothetical protein